MSEEAESQRTSSHGAIVAEALHLSLGGELVLRDLTFEVAAGRFVAVVGPSGCGKTSLLRMVAGIQCPSSGRFEILSDASASPSVAFVFQDPTLLPWRNVVDNVRLPIELGRHATGHSDDAVRRVLQLVGLRDEDFDKYPRMLSGGMRMRVSLARALVNRPEILLFDEPFAALDDLLRQRLNEDLLRLWEAERWTALFVTHNVHEAVYLSQEVWVLSDRPGTISARVRIPFTYPRMPNLRSTAEFAELTGRLSSLLRGDTA